MADLGFIKTQLGGIKDADTRRVLDTVFTHILGNLRFGDPTPQTRAENFQAYFQASTTAASTGEFSIAHGLGSAPSLAIPVIDLKQPGAQFVPLEVSRAADAKRIYLKSSVPSAPFTVLVE